MGFRNALASLAGANFAAPKRRVFFSFHPDDDILRATLVRNAGQGVEAKGPFDANLWEAAKIRGEDALRSLIDQALENTSATCILAGAHSWNSPWVRYAIAKSVARGNGLFTVDISNLQCPQNGLGAQGLNPLDNMGICMDDHGDIKLVEWNGEQWVWSQHHTAAIACPKYLAPVFNGTTLPLSRGAYLYPWSRFAKLADWAAIATLRAGQ